MIGADEAIATIVNLSECKDGIYEIVPCNESRDWETGIIDAYDMELVPYPLEKNAPASCGVLPLA